MTEALAIDLYELNMVASYLRRGMNEPATFSLVVRRLPPNRGFLVAAGLEACLEYLERFRFDEEDLAHLRDSLGFPEADLDAFRDLRFTGEVWAVPEGRIVYAGEPLLEVTAPLPEGQLAETVLLNQITLHTMLASKAARYRLAAGTRELVDFSMRRTHGIEAAAAVARDSAMVGFAATSNVDAARTYGLHVSGTMAHSYVEAFANEADSFRAFAQDFPHRTTFLVDTYDTANGVRTAIDVIRELGLEDSLGVRLDSGDPAVLSVEARRLLDDAGLGHVRIFASSGLDDLDIEDLVQREAPIDAFGVGKRLGVSADAPSLDTAYKLATYAGRPVLKLSPGKVTSPGAHQVHRLAQGDVITLRDEPPPDGAEPLLLPVMLGGQRLEPTPTPAEAVVAARVRFEADLANLPDGPRNLREPRPIEPLVSDGVRILSEKARAAALEHDSM